MDKDALDRAAEHAKASVSGQGEVWCVLCPRLPVSDQLQPWPCPVWLAGTAALGANGYVVVPLDLLDRLAIEARGVKEHGHDPKWLLDAVAAVVEAVGPTT